jgi:hypothetical protein
MALSESFWIFLLTTSAGLILAGMKICYDSKCKTCDFGCCKIERDTGAEIEAEHDRMEHGINNPLPELPKPQERQSRLSIDRE